MIQVAEFITDEDVSPFRRWFDVLDDHTAAWVTIAIDRLGEGNTSNAKALGEGVSELRINRGPGYRVYFGWDAICLSFCWAVAPSGGNRTTSRRRNGTGALTRHTRRPDE
jgi:putative addiction module killer protein